MFFRALALLPVSSSPVGALAIVEEPVQVQSFGCQVVIEEEVVAGDVEMPAAEVQVCAIAQGAEEAQGQGKPKETSLERRIRRLKAKKKRFQAAADAPLLPLRRRA